MSYKSMSTMHLQFVIEIMILMVFPVPFYESWASQRFLTNDQMGTSIVLYRFESDYLLVLMFLRFIFFFRTVFNQSIYHDEYSFQICNHHNVSSGIKFAIKCHLNRFPEWTIFLLFFFTVSLFSCILRICELPFVMYLHEKNGSQGPAFYD